MQYALTFDTPLARNSDPGTSHAAADAAKDLQARHHRIILAALEQHGPAGKDRLAALTCLTGVQVCRRLSELDGLGLAKPTGKTVKSTAGRAEREWEAV
jgi:hypothetical protein